MIKKSDVILKSIIFLAIILLCSNGLMAQGPEEDAQGSSEERMASRAGMSRVIPYPVPPFTISADRAATMTYIDRFIPDVKYGPIDSRLFMQLMYEGGTSLYEMAPRWIEICGYEFSFRLNRPFGTLPAWDYFPPPVSRKLQSRPEYTLEKTYRTRIGGMRRADIFSPDEIGRMLSANMVLDSDGPGINEQEHNLISKKYGLRRIVYVTRGEIDRFCPFINPWEEEYIRDFRAKIVDLKKDLTKRPELNGKKVLDDPETLYLLFGHSDVEPLHYFLKAVERDYDLVASSFYQEFGFPLPLRNQLVTPRECAQRIQFWFWVKRKYAELIQMRGKILREMIPKAKVVGNIHFEVWQDYERYAEAYDWVGSSIRPTLLPEEDDLGRLYWMGYGARLFADLTDKPHMISVRSNTLGAGPRVVPSASALTYWHNQAVQNGCVGFYIWSNEYPAYPGAYRGICYGNPDQSTLPKIRWNTHMRISKQLGQTKIFNPPKAETATVVSLATCALNDLGGWKRVFSSYIELCRAKVWNGFVSDQEIWEGSEKLDQYKTLYIPAMLFEKEVVAKKLMEYVAAGGTLICGDAQIFSYNLEGEDMSHYRKELFGVTGINARIKTDNEIILQSEFSDISLHPYSAGFNLIPTEGTEILGRYSDGSVAVTVHHYGKGKAYLFGSPILDIYSSDIRSFADIESKEDISRLSFYKKIETMTGTEDQSWIWDITVYNLKDVTEWVPYEPQEPDQSIQFQADVEFSQH